MTSDRGTQFTSELWSAMCNLLGTELHQTTAYHPQSNGLVERFHRNMKASLKARLDGPHWMDELPWVLLGTRTVPKEDLNSSAAELVFGAPLTVPGDFLADSTPIQTSEHLKLLRERVGNFRPIPTGTHGRNRIKTNVPENLRAAKFVFVRRDARKSPLQTPYDGPYEVLDRHDKFFTLRIGNRSEKVSIDRLKIAHLDPSEPIEVAQPPRRGRPPAVTEPLVVVQPPSQGRPPATTRYGRTTKRPGRFDRSNWGE